jgi:ribonuclease VapC
MVIDSSALVAILLQEADAARYVAAIEADPVRLLSATTYVETCIVAENRVHGAGVHDVDRLIARAVIDVISVDYEQAQIARDAFRRFGKGRHPAGLNFGDCFSYALSQAADEPLLFKGDDFPKTDIVAVL